MILCDRPCSNKSEYGYCNTTYCINPAILNTAVGYFPPPQTRKTNADRIRSMTDEELADEILRWFNWLNAVDWQSDRIINWLKEEDDET